MRKLPHLGYIIQSSDINVNSSVTHIWLFYYFADLAAKCLSRPILGKFFWGLTP